MANEMEVAAAATRITYTKRPGQVAMLGRQEGVRAIAGGASGICYGLAFVWMQAKANGNTATLWDDLAAAQNKPSTLKAAQLYAETQTRTDADAEAARLCGLALAADGAGTVKSKHALRVREASDMLALANWLAAANGTRYFLIGTGAGGHAMAASGSRFGNLEFYDPNFGVASCFRARSMAAFFAAYFVAPRIVENYWKRVPFLGLDVTKVKKA